MDPTGCTPERPCPGIQAPTPLVAASAALAKVPTPLVGASAVARCPAERVPVEAWVTVALPEGPLEAWVMVAALEERAAADMVNSRSCYRLE
jgi:hypothetical protein